jgi:FixJ family two-component response regulator
MDTAPTVFVVDDDPSIREAVASLLRSVDLEVRVFSSSQDFLKSQRPDGPGCLILDVRLPGLSGLDLQQELSRSRADVPIIFITGHGDIPMSVHAMKAGAVEFLTKPFREQDLLDAVRTAVDWDRARRQRDDGVEELRRRYETLTARERQILKLVVNGKLNKQAAALLGISEITVKVHRAQVMRKMNAKTLAGLLQMMGRLETYTSAH